MSSTALAALVVAGSLGLGGLLLIAASRAGSVANSDGDVVGRLARLAGAGAHSVPEEAIEDETTTLERVRAGIFAPLDRGIAHTAPGRSLRDRLGRAQLGHIQASEWLGMTIGAGILLGLLCAWRFTSLLPLAAGPAAGYMAGDYWVNRRVKRRLNRFSSQLPDVITSVVMGLRSGAALDKAFRVAAEQNPEPSRTEYIKALREVAAGESLVDALRSLATRMPSDDLDALITAIDVGRSGGNLAEVLESIAATVRARVEFRGHVRTLTAQGRASAIVITLLPIALAGVLEFIAPDYMTPLFTELGGQIALGVCTVSMLGAIYIMRKIVNVPI